MLPQINAISFSYFRANAAQELRFVTEEGGNLWLTRYRRPICAVISMKDANMLAAMQGRGMKELLQRLETDRARVKEAKRIEIAEREWRY